MNESERFEVVATDLVGDLGFLGLERRTLRTPSGDTVERVVVTHPGAVAVVAMAGDDIVLIEQYRAPASGVILEIPAGKLDPTDFDLQKAAERELLEETGYRAATWRTLTTMWTAVGFSDERITIFLATDLTEGARSPHGAEEMASIVRRVAFDEAVRMVTSGEITDSKTIAGIMITDAHRRAS
ncbi:MAG: NUDIX hydrolase [Armatimonadetes bacterium]|nr:MAG: NUDIX hydrolase [Armatimonadota bacterium]